MNFDVLVIEDHPLTAEGICQQIRAQNLGSVSTVGSLSEAEAHIEERTPDCVVVDMSLPDGDGIVFFDRIKKSRANLRGLLLSGLLSDADIQRACTAGFAGIVTKSSPPDVLVTALGSVAKGDSFFSPEVMPIVESLMGGDLFTPRMVEVLTMLQDGLSNKQIASELGLSEATVSFHISQIKQRLGARTNRQIVAQARKLGISLGP